MNKSIIVAGALALIAYSMVRKSNQKLALIADVGGTNVRLQLISGSDILFEASYLSQRSARISGPIRQFLEMTGGLKPTICVIGIPGPVADNKAVCCMIPRWPEVNGEEIRKEFGFEKAVLINDFIAAGYGVASLKKEEVLLFNDAQIVELGTKIVIGPGTGLGEAILFFNTETGKHDPYPSEGGHADFAVQTQEDFELMNFAKTYLKTSKNVENARHESNVTISRISTQRLGAGPAIPLLFAFYRGKYKTKLIQDFNLIESKDIISNYQTDSLCMKVVQKFIEILATECGNLALQTLPYGGIYLIGGVMAGLKPYLLTNEGKQLFLDNFQNKGRLSGIVRQFPIYLVNDEIEVGLTGAQECAIRLF